MAKEKGLGSAKRFGARYGATTKHRFASIEREQKKAQLCPYCSKPKAKRISYGIYECKKCNSKFTGRAYVTGRTRKNSPSFLRAETQENQGFSGRREIKDFSCEPDVSSETKQFESKEEVKQE